MTELEGLFTSTQMIIIIWLVVIEVVVAIVGHIVKGTFNFHELANFLRDCVLPYIIGFAVVEYVGQVLTPFDFLTQVAFVFITLTLLAGVWRALGKFGVPVPKIVSRD
ncbi:MAG: hypothetical protein A2113_04355 [Candidatus Woykebacteria bacterium GWA1_44_8]|uniref:Uncharacterized protein n=2 Tax=Microgenomates group TaxID=1794810 RepID=A0A1G1W131_9BACT|nr:MAG: hypothetical protein UX13_C0036G0004 [Candidatus Woesebacteria bacterium GW2011_GWB1_45_5]OGY21388.1 MAG: hypothetical protein A2113_04355 [Candidatus Woykebacteria bacterium GWA1_44_8]